MKKGIICLIFVVPLLIFFGCSKIQVGKFVMPTWDTQFSAPLFDRTYTLGEILAKDDTAVSNRDTTYIKPVGPTNVFSLFRTQALDGISFAGNLKIESSEANYAEIDTTLHRGQVAPVPEIASRSQSLTPDLLFQNFSYATINSGTLSITIKNGYPSTIMFQNGINVIDPSNNSLIFNIPISGNSIAPNQSYTATQSLAGLTVPNDPEVSYTYSSPGSLTSATFESDTIVAISFGLTNIVASSVSGQVHLKDPIAIASDTQKIDLGDFKSKFNGALTFSDSTRLTLNVALTGGFPSLAHLVLTPVNSSINAAPIDSAVVEQVVYPGQTNAINFGPNFVKVLNEYSMTYQLIPDEFIVSGYVIVNPGPPYVDGKITDNDRVDGTGTISLPFDIGIVNASYVDTTNKPVITDSSTSAKMSEVDSAKVYFDITNGMPLQLTFNPVLIDTANFQDTTSLGSVVVSPATQFDGNGNATSPIFRSSEIMLTRAQAMKLGSSYMKFYFTVTTPGSDQGQQVQFSANNTIKLKVYANLAFKVDKTLTGGK